MPVADTLVTVLTTDLSGFEAGFGRANSILGFFGSTLGRVATLTGLLTGGLAASVNAAGRLEQVRIALTSMEGSAEGANKRLGELQDFAQKTPFNFEEIARGAQLLRGFGAQGEQVVPIMTAVGNAVSRSGRLESFTPALLQIGQMISKGRAMGEEMRILAENGVPLNAVMKELGINAQSIGESGVSADKFLAALIKVLGHTGDMENQSKTLFGSMSNLGDAFFRLASGVGEPLIGPLTVLVKTLTDLTSIVSNAPAPVKNLIALAGVLGVGAMTAYALSLARATFATVGLTAATARLNTEFVRNGAASALLSAGGGGGFVRNGAFNSLLAAGTGAGSDGGIMGFLRGAGGIGAGVGLAGMAVSALSGENKTGQTFGNVLSGAGFGASAGSLLGPVGIAVGAIGGGLVAYIASQTTKAKAEEAQGDPHLSELKRANDLHEQMIEAIKGIKSGRAVGGRDLSGADQILTLLSREAI